MQTIHIIIVAIAALLVLRWLTQKKEGYPVDKLSGAIITELPLSRSPGAQKLENEVLLDDFSAPPPKHKRYSTRKHSYVDQEVFPFNSWQGSDLGEQLIEFQSTGVQGMVQPLREQMYSAIRDAFRDIDKERKVIGLTAEQVSEMERKQREQHERLRLLGLGMPLAESLGQGSGGSLFGGVPTPRSSGEVSSATTTTEPSLLMLPTDPVAAAGTGSIWSEQSPSAEAKESRI